MGRALPWLKDTTVTKSSNSATTTRPGKRQRTLNFQADSDSDTLPSDPAPPTSRRNGSSRPPSSSPPPTGSPPRAPPQVEYMRPGLTQDDIYIMVEDEFLSTARTFTAHLHHAEYQRLKRLSKTRPQTTNRPVDSITKMREETKRQKEAEARDKRMQSVLGKLNGAGDARNGSEESDLEDLEEERGDAPGVGTELAQLMKQSSRKNLTSLSGLNAVKSSTRAAAGFERAKPQSEERSQTRSNIFKEFSRPKEAAKATVEVKEEEPETEDEDSDDLDAPTVRRPAKPTQPVKRKEVLRDQEPKNLTKPSLPTPDAPQPGRLRSPSTSPIRKSREAILERLKRRERERKEKEKKVLDIDEIPVFLV